MKERKREKEERERQAYKKLKSRNKE